PTTLTRMPFGANSLAATFESPTMPHLLAEYGGYDSNARSAATDAMFTMAPPPLVTIAGILYFIPSHVPVRLTSITRCHVSSVHSTVFPVSGEMPALFTAKSSRPNSFIDTAI